MSKNLISIIMNCHNGEKYLKQSIESILNQNYKNWELIFFDNQSTDNSISIIEQFKDERIKIFRSNEKLSLYNARNEAIKYTNGNLISFLDTDDKWDNFFLEKLLNDLISNDCDLIYCNYFVVDEIKKKTYLNEKNFLPSGRITQSLISNYKIGVVAVLIKKKLFDQNQFDKSYDIIGDFDFFIKSSLKYKFCANQEPLAFYRVHSNSLSNKRIKLHAAELKDWLNKNKIFFKNYNLYSIEFYLRKLQIKVLLQKIKKIFGPLAQK
ncbi:MAG: glycosyltransferase [Pseudomonadota bacterium]|nr:glycosyltransferase [Pseudomonadota bacterium]